jgi:hypothetical protein
MGPGRARGERDKRRVHLTRQTTEAGSQCPRCHVTGQVAQRQPTGIVTIILIVAACAATAVAWLTRQREDVAVLRVAAGYAASGPGAHAMPAARVSRGERNQDSRTPHAAVEQRDAGDGAHSEILEPVVARICKDLTLPKPRDERWAPRSPQAIRAFGHQDRIAGLDPFSVPW